MLNKISIILLIFQFLFIFCQTKIKILDSENKKPVSYAKIILKNKDYYKNAEENGETFLESDEKILEIQSFGYENFKVKDLQSIYFLKPKFAEIEHVKISPPKFENTVNIGEIINENFTLGGFKANWTVANFFPYQENYSKTKFIKSVKFRMQIKQKNKGKIKLVFYKNENGKPSDEVWKSYILECNVKKSITEYKLEQPIHFPHNGVFIGFEWINNRENIYKQKYFVNNNSGKSYIMEDYNSISIHTQKSENDEIWILGKIIWDTPEGKLLKIGNFKQEGWLNYEDFLEKGNFDSKTNIRLSIQLELTD